MREGEGEGREREEREGEGREGEEREGEGREGEGREGEGKMKTLVIQTNTDLYEHRQVSIAHTRYMYWEKWSWVVRSYPMHYLVFNRFWGHDKRLVSQLIVVVLVGRDADGLGPRPVLSVDDRLEKPGRVGFV